METSSSSSSPRITYDELVHNSETSGFPFPVQTNRARVLVEEYRRIKPQDVERYANGVRPILHKRVAALAGKWISYKLRHGTPKEQHFYKSITNLHQFVTRLLLRRPLTFVTAEDQWMTLKRLLSGKTGDGTHRGWSGFEEVGTEALDAEEQAGTLTLEKFMSYDEIKVSALLSLSSYSYYINSGGRYNNAQLSDEGGYISEGVIVGQVGARFERPGKMDWEDCVVTKDNTVENGFGANADPANPKTEYRKMWAELYQVPHLCTFEEAEADDTGRFVKLQTLKSREVDSDNSPKYLDTLAYTGRMQITAEVLLMEANARGQAAGQRTWVHVTGLGLGVWLCHSDQIKYFMHAYEKAIKNLRLPFVADINFAWMEVEHLCGVRDKQYVSFCEQNKHIRIHFQRWDPHRRLEDQDAEKNLVVESFAWDGNAYPGNEYWYGANFLSVSGDPAAAACSMIGELHNGEINTVCTGEALHIANPEGGGSMASARNPEFQAHL
eukprot:TRINITY_DN67529_c3_g9_i1.p1 TRINITY_DN67529_c3_g9~~TRINITY_DN67529_c3_g9_i1.p1  ORF type:complete len:496 (-),score=33.90 TRINITY_DN67529_c3_g9_i1:1469-2956(-)